MVQIITLYWTMDPDPGLLYNRLLPPAPRRCYFFPDNSPLLKWPIPVVFVTGGVATLVEGMHVAQFGRLVLFVVVVAPIAYRHVVCAILRPGSVGITCYPHLGMTPETFSLLNPTS